MQKVHPRDAGYRHVLEAITPVPAIIGYIFAEDDAVSDSAIKRWIAQRAEGISLLRQRMVHPYGYLGDDYWSGTPELSPEDQITVLHIAQWSDCQEFLARIQPNQFDWSRPAWEIYVVRGVENIGPWETPCIVVVFRFHHSIADGGVIAGVMKQLFTGEIPTEPVIRTISRGEATLRGLASAPLWIPRLLIDIYRAGRAQRRIRADIANGTSETPLMLSPGTSVNHPVGNNLIIGIVFAPLLDVREAAAKVGGVTPNDVVLATVGSALSRYLDSPRLDLVCSVPVTTQDLETTFARNYIVQSTVSLFTTIGDFTERTRLIHRSVQAERARLRGPNCMEAHRRFPPRAPIFLYRFVARWNIKSRGHSSDAVVSHTSISSISEGATDGRELCGSPMLANFAVPIAHAQLGTAHAAFSVGEYISVSVSADGDQVTNLSKYKDQLQSAFAALKNLN